MYTENFILEQTSFLNANTNMEGQVTGTCECGNEPSGSIKCGEFID